MSFDSFAHVPLSLLAWAAQMAAFHGIGYAFEWCDSTGRLRRFKVRAIDRMSYRELLPRVLLNQTFILLPCMLAAEYFGLAFVGAPHLSWTTIVLSILGLGVGHDIVQYVAHRHLLHHPAMMQKLGHALHHTTGASKAISACYQSSADFFFEIVLPYLLPLALVGGGSSVAFHMIVPALGALGGLYEHSGYDFGVAFRGSTSRGWRRRLDIVLDNLTSSIAHGNHHTRGNVSFSDGFGSPGLCDTFFRTRWDLVPERLRRRERERGERETVSAA